MESTFRDTKQGLKIFDDPTLDAWTKLVEAFACYTGFILGSEASVSSMDELVKVSLSFIPETVERFEREFLETVAAHLSPRNGHSSVVQTEILNAVSRGLKYSVTSTQVYKATMSAAIELLMHPQP